MIDQTVSRYRIIEKLGQGGMGVVYKALDTRLDGYVAVKILPSESVSDTERRRRFVQEAKAASALNHPGIVTVRDLDSPGDLSFIVMVDGGGPAFAVSRITADPGLTFTSWVSPDGKLLAYASDRGGQGNLDIWVQQPTGREPIQRTRDQADDWQPCFSPDGTRIVFRSERDGGGIFLMDTLGGEERKIADRGLKPTFSPDGNWIVYHE